MKVDKIKIEPPNILIMYISAFLGGMLFFLPILALYFEKNLFTISNVALIFSIESVAVVFLEIPTGVVSDFFGRKITMMLDYVITLFSLTFLLFGDNMAMFIAYAVSNALAMSLSSGTENALIYDTLKNENREHEYKKVIGRYYALWSVGSSIAAVVGGYLAKISLSLPIFVSYFPSLLSLGLLFFIKEPLRKAEKKVSTGKHIFSSLKIIIKNKQLVILLLGGFIFYGFGQAAYRLDSLFFKFKEIPIFYFGYIFALSMILSSVGSYLSHDISEYFGNKKTLVCFIFLSAIFLIMATMNFGYVSIMFFLFLFFLSGVKGPIIDYFLNMEIKSNNRATVNSVLNFTNKLGLAIFAPFIGYFAEFYTINVAFRISGVVMFFIPILFLFLKEKKLG